MQRYFLRLSYKGTNYHGWQVQPNALGVQAVIEAGLTKLLRVPTNVLGCGRTDAGVHALDYYLHFDYGGPSLLTRKDFIYHLNCVLPTDIAIKEVMEVKENAHARFDALSRTYEYRIIFAKDPFRRDRAFLTMNNLDLNMMREGAKILMEYTDFASFSKHNSQVKTTICKLMKAEWEETADGLVFRIQADRFLRNMVRAITGTLIDMGKGRVSNDDLRRIIEDKKRASAGVSVPACGLYLVEINYPAEIFL